MIRTASGLLRSDPRVLAEGFLAWWLGELRQLVPDRLVQALAATPRRLVVELGPVVTLRLIADGAELVLARIPATDRAGLAAALVDAGREVRLELRLPREKVLRRRLELPLTRDRDLRPLLSFELARQTPLAAEDVHYDVRVLARDRARHRMTVEVALARRSAVEAAVAELAACGVRPAFVQADAEDGWVPTLLTLVERSPAERRRRWLQAALGGLAVLLLAGLVVADGVRREATRAALQAQLVQEKEAAEATKALQAKAAALTASRSFLPAQRQARALSTMMEELARILPDDTWLTNLSLDGEAIHLQGSSGGADRLIELIDASPLFTDARFSAPLVRSPGAATDRFDIVLKRRHGEAK
jgi:general secretion pathway protein L